MTENPFIGLESYNELQGERLFGRDRDLLLVMDRITSKRTTLLFAGSGVGKTSFLRAKVCPSLERYYNVVFHNEWSGRWQPLDPVKEKICQRAGVATEINGSLMRLLTRVSDREAASDPVRWCLVLDQFEEIFQYHTYEDYFTKCIDDLCETVSATQIPFSIVISMREEFLGELSVFDNKIPDLFANYYRLKYPNVPQGEDIIRLSAEASGRPVDPEGLKRLVIDLSTIERGVGSFAERSPDTPVEKKKIQRDFVIPPYLQIVCQRLWAQKGTTTGGSLSEELAPFLKSYQSSQAQRLLEAFCNEKLDGLSRAERKRAFKAFDFLVTKQGAKMAYEVKSLARHTGIQENLLYGTLHKLSLPETRILRESGGPDGSRWFELYHDIYGTVIDRWKAAFDDHLQTRSLFLGIAALFLVIIVLGIVMPAVNLSKLEQIVDETTRLNRAAGGPVEGSTWEQSFTKVATLRSGSLNFPWFRGRVDQVWAMWWEKRARFAEQSQNREEALLARLDALAAAPSPAGRRFAKALLRPSDDHLTATLRPAGTLLAALFSTDGKAVVTVTEEQQARAWRLSGEPIAAPVQLDSLESGVGLLDRFSLLARGLFRDDFTAVSYPRYRFLIGGAQRGALRIWRADSGRRFSDLSLEARASEVTFSGSGRWVAWMEGVRTLRIAELDEKRDTYVARPPVELKIIDGPTAYPLPRDRYGRWTLGNSRTIAFSPDERRILVTTSRDAYLFDVARNVIQRSWRVPGIIWSSAVGPRYAVLAQGDSARIYDLGSAQDTGRPAPITGVVRLKPDGETLISLEDGNARSWNLRTGAQLGEATHAFPAQAAHAHLALSPELFRGSRVDGAGENILSYERGGVLRIHTVRAGDFHPAKSIESPFFFSAANLDGTVRIIVSEVRDRAGRLLLRTYGTLLATPILTPSGRYLVYRTGGNHWRLVAVPRQPAMPETLIAEWQAGRFGAAVDERDGWLAWGDPKRVWLLNTSTGERFSTALEGLGASRIEVDRGGRRLAVVNELSETSRRITVLQREGGALRKVFVDQIAESINAVVFTAEGGLIAGANDNVAYVWPENGGEPARLRHDAPVTAVAPVPGREGLLITGVQDGTVHVWSLGDRQEIGEGLNFGSKIDSIEASKDGRMAIAYSGEWAHQLRVDAAGIRATDSLYLPRIRGTRMAMEDGGQAVRAWIEGSEEPRAIRFDRSKSPELTGDPQELLNHWERALGLRFNDAGRVDQLWPDVPPALLELKGPALRSFELLPPSVVR